MKKSLSELDVIFISYDEPNADENWADLLSKCPWAKRSHGVYGSDAAHKAAAKLSETDRFIGVDGDNIIDPSIFNLEFDESVIDGPNILSFKGINVVNGLVYGNGGIKCWPVEAVMNMKTHEIAETERGQIEFCWDLQYHQIDKVYSKVYNNASPLQAFRAGFREGCKMSLDEGKLHKPADLVKNIYPDNFKRLKTWMTIGVDVENGLWAMYGARLGFVMTNIENWDYINVRDFEYLNNLWHSIIKVKFTDNPNKECIRTNFKYNENTLLKEIERLGKQIEKTFNFDVPLIDAKTSRFLKGVL